MGLVRQIMRGDVYFASFHQSVGSEQNGDRPVIIIQNDVGNKFSPTVIVASITSRIGKNPIPTHVRLNVDFLSKDSIALLEQVGTMDKSRLQHYVGCLDMETMREIDCALKISMGVQ